MWTTKWLHGMSNLWIRIKLRITNAEDGCSLLIDLTENHLKKYLL